jgi:tetratricopeptide (TPR) repeat protein
MKNKFHPIFIAMLTLMIVLPSCTDKKEEAHKLVKAGTIKLYQANYYEALEDFTKAVGYDPENPEAWYSIGNVYMNLKDYQKAIEYYTKAIEIKEDYADAYYNRGMVKFYMGERDLACEDWHFAEKYGKSNVNDKTRHCD